MASMNAAKQAGWLFLILITLACSGWYFASTSSHTFKLDDKTLSSTPDTIISHLTVKQFDDNGHVSNYLQTPYMEHVPLNNTHQLVTPHIIVTQKNQTPWEIHAMEATALHGGQKITFNKHVIIHQKQNEQTQETTLKTEQITYFPKKQLATTPKDVTFVQAGNVVESTGMRAYLAENHVQLLNNARGTYAATHE